MECVPRCAPRTARHYGGPVNEKTVNEKIVAALGDPQSGAIAEAMPLIMGAVAAAFAPEGDAKSVRITKVAETR